jgi:hypothetical protein
VSLGTGGARPVNSAPVATLGRGATRSPSDPSRYRACCFPCSWLQRGLPCTPLFLKPAQHLPCPFPDDIYADVCLPAAAQAARQLALMLRDHPAGLSTRPLIHSSGACWAAPQPSVLQ